ncbi:MAG: RNA methyltransferase [Candidatus Woesearchaeota archaeon]
MTKFIIEHLDPKLWKWSFVEYKHISEIVGKKNTIYTNIRNTKEKDKLSKYGKVEKRSVKEMILKNACILDPSAKKLLEPNEKFDYIVLGGVLGDYPRKKRTKKELTDKIRGMDARNLGKFQMSTNTAAYVAWKIINGTPLKDIKFRRKLKVKDTNNLEIELPFSFVEENGELVLPKGYIDLVKNS